MISPVYEHARNGLLRSDRGEQGGLHGRGGFTWAFKALVVFSVGRELSQEIESNREWVLWAEQRLSGVMMSWGLSTLVGQREKGGKKVRLELSHKECLPLDLKFREF